MPACLPGRLYGGVQKHISKNHYSHLRPTIEYFENYKSMLYSCLSSCMFTFYASFVISALKFRFVWEIGIHNRLSFTDNEVISLLF
jgi:hypothetical protein